MNPSPVLKSDYICHPCGIKYGTPRGHYSTYHISACGWCGEETAVTHCRAYNYPIRPQPDEERVSDG